MPYLIYGHPALYEKGIQVPTPDGSRGSADPELRYFYEVQEGSPCSGLYMYLYMYLGTERRTWVSQRVVRITARPPDAQIWVWALLSALLLPQIFP